MNLLYFGSSAFSTPAIYSLGDSITHVITKRAKPKGRGYLTEASEVKRVADSLHLPVIEIDSFKGQDVQALTDLKPDLLVVVSFGLIIPKWFLAIPTVGAINVHPSALPKYRGPSPIQWAIWNGETDTALTIIGMNERMDAGNILLQEKVPIPDSDDAHSLSEKLARRTSEILPAFIDSIAKEGMPDGAVQDEGRASYTPIIKKEMGLIDWDCSSIEILRQIRALVEWPTAYTALEGKALKIFRAEMVSDHEDFPQAQPGDIVRTTRDGIDVTAQGGLLRILEVQLENKKRMNAAEFARGYRGGLTGKRFQR